MSMAFSLAIPEDVWPGVMSRIHASVGTEEYEAWFARLKIDAFEGATARLSVPTKFLRRWIEDRHKSLVLACVKAEVPYIRRVKIGERSNWFAASGEMKLLPDLRNAPPSPAPIVTDTVVVTEPSEPVPMPRKTLARAIIKSVCDHYAGVSPADVRAHRRIVQHVHPRHVAMYLIKKHTNWSLPKVGREFGGKDHTSVLNAVRRVERRMKEGHEKTIEVIRSVCAEFYLPLPAALCEIVASPEIAPS